MINPLRIIVAGLLVAGSIWGFHSITHYHHKLEIQKLELKSNQLKVKTVEMQYDKALKDLDSAKGDAQKLQEAQDKLNQLEQEKTQLEAQLQSKRDQQASDKVYAAELPVSSPVKSSYSGTGDQYLDWIIAHESGGNAYAVNRSSGACGLAQELPCGKSGCQLGEAACQINWMRNYCKERYGSTYNAYLYWQAHHNY